MVDVVTLQIRIDGGQAQGQAGRITADIRRMGAAGDDAQRRMGGLSSALGAFARVAGIAAAAVGGISFSRVAQESATYERALSSLRAVSQATETEMARFAATARELGATSPYNATQSVQGMEALASAGQSTTQVLQSIKPALALASAGTLELSQAAELGASTLNQFGLSADNFQRVADTLAQGAATGATSVAQLGEALGNTGKTASDAGFSLERTVAILTALSDSNIKGAESGTAFRGVIASMVAATGPAADILEKYSANAGTAEERMLKLAEAGLSDAEMFQIFGREGKEAASVILDSIPKINSYTQEMEGAAGAVDRMAATIEDNLIGDLTAAGSALSEMALQLGFDSGLTGALREATQEFTAFITEINEAPKARGLTDLIARTDAELTEFFSKLANEVERFISIGIGAFRAFYVFISEGAPAAGDALKAGLLGAVSQVAKELETLYGTLGLVSGALGFEKLSSSLGQAAVGFRQLSGNTLKDYESSINAVASANQKALKTFNDAVTGADNFRDSQNKAAAASKDLTLLNLAVDRALDDQKRALALAAEAAGTLAEETENTKNKTASAKKEIENTATATKSYGSALSGAAEEADKLTVAQEEAARAADELQRSFDSAVESLTRQIALFGQTGEAARLRYEIESGALQGISAQQEQYLESLLEQLNQKEQAEVAAEKLAEAEEAAANKTLEAWEFVGNSITDLFTSVWRGLIDGSKSVGDTLKDWFKGLLAQLAEIAFRNAVVVPFISNVTGNASFAQSFAGPALGSLFNGGAQAPASPGSSGFGSTPSGGFGSLFGGYSISDTIGSSEIGAAIGLEGVQVSNIALFGAGIAGSYIGGELFEGEYASTGGSFGASAGALYGSAFGPIGTAVGAVLGAVAGGFIGSLFGGDYEPYPYSLVQVGAGGLPIGDSDNITRGAPVLGASGLQFAAVSKHTDLAGAQALQDELLALDSVLASMAPAANLAGVNLGDYGETLDGTLAGLDGYQEAGLDITAQFVRNWLRAADVIDERARDLVLDMEGSGRELTASFAALVTLFEYTTSSPMAAYQAALEQSQVTLWGAAQAQRDYVISLMSSFDGTPEQLAQLSTAVAARYDMELALIGQIMNMIQGVQQLGASAADQFRLATLNEEQIYNLRVLQAEAARNALADLEDPAEILRTFQEGIAAQQSAFNALNAEQQAIVGEQFARWTEEFQAEAEAALSDRASQIETENQALSSVIETALQNPANSMLQAAEQMQQAAAVMQAALAAGMPVQVVTVQSDASVLGFG